MTLSRTEAKALVEQGQAIEAGIVCLAAGHRLYVAVVRTQQVRIDYYPASDTEISHFLRGLDLSAKLR